MVTPKGRPAGKNKTQERVSLTMTTAELKALDAFRKADIDQPPRAVMIRRLVRAGIAAKSAV